MDSVRVDSEGIGHARARTGVMATPDPSILSNEPHDRRDVIPDSPLVSDKPLGWEATITSSSQALGWDGVIAKRFRSAPGEHYFPTVPEDMASVYLGQPVRSVRWSDNSLREGTAVRGDVTLKASGQPSGWRFDKDVDVLVMRLAPAFLYQVAEENGLNPDAVELRASLDRRDGAVEHIGLAMLAEMEAEGPTGRVYGDALATALATHLLRNHGTHPQALTDHRGGLPRDTLRRVTDYVYDNLSRDIGLSEMAAVANLSRYHFSRQFKRSTGLSPHQYVVGRRVERARELLSSTDLPVGDVASAVGFTHQSHLARHVRRHYCVAPSALRR
jgi:AraC family transcriptional regulator